MGYRSVQPFAAEVWELAAAQHGVVARTQLRSLGLSAQMIKRRVHSGRLHPVMRGVYAVGRPQLTHHGRWMAAVLSCGPEAVLSHGSASALWEIGTEGSRIEVSVPAHRRPRRPEVVVQRRFSLDAHDLTEHHGIPVTAPIPTIIDMAARSTPEGIERMINEADKRDLADPEALREALASASSVPGVGALRATLDRRTFTLTDSELERRFLPIAREAGLELPQTRQLVDGFKIDFYWPDMGLIVETDGLRYHRTPAQQARDHLRDQAHVAAGLTCLRFTHAQVRFEPGHVRLTLAAVARRLRSGKPTP